MLAMVKDVSSPLKFFLGCNASSNLKMPYSQRYSPSQFGKIFRAEELYEICYMLYAICFMKLIILYLPLFILIHSFY